MDFEEESKMKNATGMELFCKYWKPDLEAGEKPRALVFIVHGYAEHCRTYDDLAQFFAEKKFFVFSHDHVGHGQSPGDRALVAKFSTFVDDVIQHADKVKEAIPDVPLFLLGHSMGGTISLLMALERPTAMKGVALISPAITFDVTPFKAKLVKIVSFVYKSYGMLTLEAKALSRDEKVVKQCEEDPLTYHGTMKAGMANELLGALDQLQGRLEEIKVPLLIQHGTADSITPLEGARMLNEKAVAYDKTLSIYQDGFHSLHKEPFGMADQVLSELAEWFEARL